MFVILNDAAKLVLYMPLVFIALASCMYLSFRLSTYASR
jgi:hypothetical protein